MPVIKNEYFANEWLSYPFAYMFSIYSIEWEIISKIMEWANLAVGTAQGEREGGNNDYCVFFEGGSGS